METRASFLEFWRSRQAGWRCVEAVAPETQLNLQGRAQLEQRQAEQRAAMLAKYPHLQARGFNGKIAYLVRGESPKQVMAQGGFVSRSDLWLANTGSGQNEGCICLSLLPEVSAIFDKHVTGQAYLYAVSLVGQYCLPGGNWRQIISPGALPLPTWWLARPIIAIEGRQLRLGSLVGQTEEWSHVVPGEHFARFLNNQVEKPEEIDLGEDYPLEYLITDTAFSRTFQQQVSHSYALKV